MSEETSAALEALARSGHIFGSVVREVVAERFLETAAAEKLGIPELALLELFALPGTHPVGQIATFLNVSAAAASKRADKLERLGLVARTPDARDRRVTYVSLTDQGRELLARYHARERDILLRAAPGVKAGDIAALAQLLEKLALALLATEKHEPPVCLRCGARYRSDCAVHTARRSCPFRRAAK